MFEARITLDNGLATSRKFDTYAERDTLSEATADDRIAALLAAQDATWTLELTVQRRAEWNAWIRSQRGIQAADILQQMQAQGWSVVDLKHAIERHGL